MTENQKSQKQIYSDAIDLIAKQLVASNAFTNVVGQVDTQTLNMITNITNIFKTQLDAIQQRIEQGTKSVYLPQRAAVISADDWMQAGDIMRPAYIVTNDSLETQFSLAVDAMVIYACETYVRAEMADNQRSMKDLQLTKEFAEGLQQALYLGKGKALNAHVSTIFFPPMRCLRAQ